MADCGPHSLRDLEAAVRAIVPPLSGENYKGQAGMIGVIGGCREYTGAPYFAAISALKVGADLSHIFCTSGAAPVIKSYSPELIVHPYLPDSSDYPDELHREEQERIVSKAEALVDKWVERFDALVVGPGLGRDPLLHETVIRVLRRVRELETPVLLDADGLYIATKNLDLVRGHCRAILTPNRNEFARLAKQLGIDESREDAQEEVARALDGPVLVRKGKADAVTRGGMTLRCPVGGSPRRAGGQGDIISGVSAAMAAWAVNHGKLKGLKDDTDWPLSLSPLHLAAFGGCLVGRYAQEAAFKEKGRYMLAADVIEHLGAGMDRVLQDAPH